MSVVSGFRPHPPPGDRCGKIPSSSGVCPGMGSRPPDVLLSSHSDEQLVLLARAGHEPAFVAIVERYRPELEALARRLCSNGHSEDIVQQAFLSAFAALSAGSEVRHLRGWLYRIVRNAATRPTGPLCVPLDGAAASASSVEDVVQQRVLAVTALSELSRLPDRQRQAMIGTALDGRARAEVASSMGLSEGAVRQLVHRARTTLRGALTAVIPLPLGRWIAAARPDVPGTAELAAGAGAASSGGLAIKLGAVLASGTLLTGAAIDLRGVPAHPAHPDGARAAISVHARPHLARVRPVVVASVASPALTHAVSARAPVAELTTLRSRTVTHAGGGAPRASSHAERHHTDRGRSGGRDGGPAARQDGHGGQPSGADSSSRGGRDGNRGSSPGGSGSGDLGRDGGQSPGARGGSGGDAGSGSPAGSGSDHGGDAQIASDSHAFDAVDRGSGSGPGSGFGEGSGSGDGSVPAGDSAASGGTGSWGPGTSGSGGDRGGVVSGGSDPGSGSRSGS